MGKIGKVGECVFRKSDRNRADCNGFEKLLLPQYSFKKYNFRSVNWEKRSLSDERNIQTTSDCKIRRIQGRLLFISQFLFLVTQPAALAAAWTQHAETPRPVADAGINGRLVPPPNRPPLKKNDSERSSPRILPGDLGKKLCASCGRRPSSGP